MCSEPPTKDFKPAVIVFESGSNPKIHQEEELIRQEALRREISVRELSVRHLANGLKGDEFPMGALPFMEAAFSASSVKFPAVAGYPSSLERWLHRSIWQCTWGELQTSFRTGKRRKPVFVKPAELSKLFRGRVVYSDLDMARFSHLEETKIWCADIVNWQVEWRCYVIDGIVRGAQCYWWNGRVQQGAEPRGVKLDFKEVEPIVEALIKCDHAVRTFTLDVGLLTSGKLAVVEWDYAYSVGSYGLPAADYFDFLWAGWRELVG